VRPAGAQDYTYKPAFAKKSSQGKVPRSTNNIKNYSFNKLCKLETKQSANIGKSFGNLRGKKRRVHRFVLYTPIPNYYYILLYETIVYIIIISTSHIRVPF